MPFNTCGPTAIAPCAFQLDVQWILDAVKKLQDLISSACQIAQEVLGIARSLLQGVSQIFSEYCVLGWFGKFLTAVVDAACRFIQEVVSKVRQACNSVLEALKGVLAPWEVRSAGTQIRDQLAPKCSDFAQSLQVGNLKSSNSWTGGAADMFSTSMQRQYTTGTEVAAAVKEYGEKVAKIGSDGVETTVKFLKKLVETLREVIDTTLAAAEIPTGTGPAVIRLKDLLEALIGIAAAFVSAMMEVIQQVSELEQAAAMAPGYAWPKARA